MISVTSLPPILQRPLSLFILMVIGYATNKKRYEKRCYDCQRIGLILTLRNVFSNIVIITKFSQIVESTVGYLGVSSVRYCLELIVRLPHVSN